MARTPTGSTRTDTPFPYTTRSRSYDGLRIVVGELPFILLFRFLGFFGWIAPHCVDGAKTEHNRAAGHRRQNDRLFWFDRPVRKCGNLGLTFALPLNVFRIGDRLLCQGTVFQVLATRNYVEAMLVFAMLLLRHLLDPSRSVP